MTNIPPPFFLTPTERAQPVWIRLKAHLEDKLREARGKNDGDSNTEQQTATLRGQIKTLKGLIALGEEPPPQDG